MLPGIPVPAPEPQASEPSAQPVEPPPVETAPLPETRAVKPRRLWLVVGCVAAASAVGGYGLAALHRSKDDGKTADLPSVHTPSPEPPDRGPVTTPGPSPAPVVPPMPAPPPPEPAKLDADATLKAFLEAPDWRERAKHVLVPDQVRELIEKHAAQAGDGPIPVTAVHLDDLQAANYLYKVKTVELPDGFPVALIATDEGPKVDWEAFVGFHDDHFRKFAEGPVGRSGIFQLLVKPDPSENEEGAHFQRFRLGVPMPDREQLAWMKKDAVGLAKLRAVFQGGPSLDKATVDKMVEGQGVPVVLALEKKETNDGKAFIEITDYVAFGWGPRRQ